jgi:hypothetical protein
LRSSSFKLACSTTSVRGGCTGGDRARVARVEVAAPAEQAGVEHVELAPELVEAVLHRRAGQRHAEVGAQPVSGPGHLARRVLDCVGLVEDQRVPLHVRQPVCVESQHRPRREGHVHVGIEGATRSVEARPGERGPEARDLFGPVVEDAGGRHDQGASAQAAQGLQRLAEPHVVGEECPQSGVAQRAEPVHAFALIAAQAGGQILGQRRRLCVQRRLEPCAQGRGVVGHRGVQVLAQLREVGQRRPGQRAVLVSRRQQVGDPIAEAGQPVVWERREAAVR